MNIYEKLKNEFRKTIRDNNIEQANLSVTCRALSSYEAIGDTEHKDYPIITGKEVMVQAEFQGSFGQSFSDSFEQKEYSLKELSELSLVNNTERASFIAGLNAVYRHLGLADKSIHCRDNEPVECAGRLLEEMSFPQKVVLIGFQPRFLEELASKRELRVIDLNPENIGKTVNGITVESADMTDDALDWCDMIFATGSTIINGTIARFIEHAKPAVFYGISISAAAEILGLQKYCALGK